MEELVELILKTYGLIGLFMVSPFIAVIFLWRNVMSLHKEIHRLNELRIADAQKVSDKLIGMVQEQSGLTKETNLILEKVGDVLTITTAKR